MSYRNIWKICYFNKNYLEFGECTEISVYHVHKVILIIQMILVGESDLNFLKLIR